MRRLNNCLVFIAISLLLVIFSLSFTPQQITLVIDGQEQNILTKAETVEELLEELGYNHHEKDIIKPGLQEALTNETIVSIDKARPFTVLVDDKTELVWSTASRVAQVLEDAGIKLSEKDEVMPAANDKTFGVSKIEVTRVAVEEKIVEAETSFESVKTNDRQLERGLEKVVQKGSPGKVERVYQVTYINGDKVSEELVDERTIVESKNEIIAVGIKEISIPIASRGDVTRVASAYEGEASWYGGGDGFHGATTASGEIYNRYEYTAAHRSLPFDTLVRVTYQPTGKSVIVRINDRGPFNHRIIDLSMAAAEEIGLRPAGVGWVKVEVLE